MAPIGSTSLSFSPAGAPGSGTPYPSGASPYASAGAPVFLDSYSASRTPSVVMTSGPVFVGPTYLTVNPPAPNPPAPNAAPSVPAGPPKPRSQGPNAPPADQKTVPAEAGQLAVRTPQIILRAAKIADQIDRLAMVGQAAAQVTEPWWIAHINQPKLTAFLTKVTGAKDTEISKMVGDYIDTVKATGGDVQAGAYVVERDLRATEFHVGGVGRFAIKSGINGAGFKWVGRAINGVSAAISAKELLDTLADPNATIENKIAHGLHLATSVIGIVEPVVGLVGDAAMLSADILGITGEQPPTAIPQPSR